MSEKRRHSLLLVSYWNQNNWLTTSPNGPSAGGLVSDSGRRPYRKQTWPWNKRASRRYHWNNSRSIQYRTGANEQIQICRKPEALWRTCCSVEGLLFPYKDAVKQAIWFCHIGFWGIWLTNGSSKTFRIWIKTSGLYLLSKGASWVVLVLVSALNYNNRKSPTFGYSQHARFWVAGYISRRRVRSRFPREEISKFMVLAKSIVSPDNS